MKTTINERRLDDLAREISRLDEAAVNAVRDAVDIQGDELTCELLTERVIAAKAELERALRAYFIESEVIRRGDARRVAA